MLIWMILILLGIAHEEEGACDPFPMMERKAATGGLTHEIEECLQRKVENPLVAENQRWVLWIGRWRAGGSIAGRNKQARALLETSQLPDRALWLAQTVAKDDPKLALEALERAEAIAESLGKHGNHPINQINTGSPVKSFFIKNGILWHVGGYISNMHSKVVISIIQILNTKRIIKINRTNNS